MSPKIHFFPCFSSLYIVAGWCWCIARSIGAQICHHFSRNYIYILVVDIVTMLPFFHEFLLMVDPSWTRAVIIYNLMWTFLNPIKVSQMAKCHHILQHKDFIFLSTPFQILQPVTYSIGQAVYCILYYIAFGSYVFKTLPYNSKIFLMN